MTLQGSIDSFPLADVLRLLGSTHKSGALVLEGDRGSGRVWMDDGQVVGGASALAGEAPVACSLGDVLFDLMRYERGSFEFDATGRCSATVSPTPIDTLLAQAEADLREWADIARVVASPECVLELVEDLADGEVLIDQRRWAAIVALQGRATVVTIAGRLSLSDLPAMRLAADLVTSGLARVAAPEVAESDTSLSEATSVAAAPFDSAPFVPHSLEPAPAPSFEPSSFEPSSFEPASFEPASFEPSFEPAAFEPASFEREVGAAASSLLASNGLDASAASDPGAFAVEDADLDALFEPTTAWSAPVEPAAPLASQLSGLSASAARAIAAATAGSAPGDGDDAGARPAAHTFGGLSGTV